jgi:hypothetical protein
MIAAGDFAAAAAVGVRVHGSSSVERRNEQAGCRFDTVEFDRELLWGSVKPSGGPDEPIRPPGRKAGEGLT